MPDAEPALTAARMSEAFGFDLVLAPAVVLVFDAAAVPERATTRAQRKMAHPFRQVGSLNDHVDIVLAAGPGAPVAAITVELLAHFGVHRFVTVGTAGDLMRDGDQASMNIELPLLNVIARAESDEGTSSHYGSDLTADPELMEGLLDLAGGPARAVLTTDVPFRHTPERLTQHRARADLVEMECAALFAASRYFGIRSAALLVTSDVFEEMHWRPLERRTTTEGLREAVRMAAEALTSSW